MLVIDVLVRFRTATYIYYVYMFQRISMQLLYA